MTASQMEIAADITARCLSFSGGRSSAYMLWLMVQDNLRDYGVPLLPTDFVVFANTGKEREETLEFVRDCAQHWGIHIHWIERDPHTVLDRRRHRKLEKVYTAAPKWVRHLLADYLNPLTIATSYIHRDFETASRDGKPFEWLIDEKGMPPNVMARFCTDYLKVKPIEAFMKYKLEILNHRGMYEGSDYDMLIGFRYDEPQRVTKKKLANQKGNQPYTYRMPLHEKRITKADVEEFWKGQPFDLNLKSYQGNCDLCFLKGRAKLAQILRENPELGDWWIMMENYHGGTFRKGEPYIRIKQLAKAPVLFAPEDLDEGDDLTVNCVCGD